MSVTAPNFLHREIGVAVAEAGKHLWIEKPVGLTSADAAAVRDAVRASGVVGCVGFNYRHVPAVARARRIVESGQIGVPTHARVQLLTDYAAHPGSPLSWRYTLESGGHGVLGDLASHGVDLLRFVLGDVTGVMARTAIHIPQRPVAQAAGPLRGARRRRAGAGLRRGRERGLRRRGPADGVGEPSPSARPTGPRWASRTTTPSRCTAPGAW